VLPDNDEQGRRYAEKVAGSVSLSGEIHSATEATSQADITGAGYGAFSDADIFAQASLEKLDGDFLVDVVAEASSLSHDEKSLLNEDVPPVQVRASTVLSSSLEQNDFAFSLLPLSLKDYDPSLSGLFGKNLGVAGVLAASGKMNSLGEGVMSWRLRDLSVGEEGLRGDIEIDLLNTHFEKPTGRFECEGNLRMDNVSTSGVSLDPASMSFSLSYDDSSSSLRLKSGRLHSDGFEAQVTGIIPTKGNASLEADILKVDLARLTETFRERLNRFPISEMEGSLHGKCQISKDLVSRSPVTANANLNLEGISGTDETGRILWMDVGGRTEINYQAGGDKTGTDIEGEVSLNKGEVLFDTVYNDLGSSALGIALNVRIEDDAAVVRNLDISIPKTLDLDVASEIGLVTPYAFDARFSARANLGNLLERLLIPALAGSTELLEGGSARGSLSIDGAVQGDCNGQFVKGKMECLVEDSVLPNLAACRLSQVSANIPFSLALGDSELREEGAGNIGNVSVEQLETRLLDIADISLLVTIVNNTLNIPSPTTINLWRGKVNVDAFQMENVMDGNSQMSANGSLENLDLATLTEKLGLQPMNGTVSCDRLLVEAQDGDMRLPDPFVIDVFGGRILASEVEYLDYTERYPTFKISAMVEDLDLGQMSSTLSIGDISGTLVGYVRNLSVRGGWPISFDIELETVPKRGMEQRVSSEAIKTMVVMPQMLQQVALNEILARADVYSYKKIGLHAWLEGNILRMEGTVSKGQEMYLMLGAGWTPLHIISHGGEKGMPFREYVKVMKAQIKSARERSAKRTN